CPWYDSRYRARPGPPVPPRLAALDAARPAPYIAPAGEARCRNTCTDSPLTNAPHTRHATLPCPGPSHHPRPGGRPRDGPGADGGEGGRADGREDSLGHRRGTRPSPDDRVRDRRRHVD